MTRRGGRAYVRGRAVLAGVVAVGAVLAGAAACTTAGAAEGARAAAAESATGTAAASSDVGQPPDVVVTVPQALPSARMLPPLPAATAATAEPMYASTVQPVDDALARRMSASWRAGCPVPLADLRYVTVTYVGFDGAVRVGELVVHTDVADAVTRVFGRLFAARYPIRSMRLVDDFGASDDASMAADNTSAFNCRPVTGGTRWSEHAFGRAIDLNPVENPYVTGDHVAPDAGASFAPRVPAPGVVLAGDVVVQAFAAEGWQWGGAWLPPRPQDYQHFSPSGR